jgi:methyl-accepting chemotaxis protein
MRKDKKFVSLEFKNSMMILVMILINSTSIGFLVQHSKSMLLIWMFILFFCIVFFTISSRMTRKWVVSPLEMLLNAAESIAEGYPNVSVTQKTQDQMGVFIGSFSRMADHINKQFNLIRQIAEGNFNSDIFERNDPGFLLHNMRRIVNDLNKLNAEKNTYVKILDSIQVPIYIMDKEYHVTFANKSALEYTVGEMDRKEIIGLKCYEIFNSDREGCKGLDSVQPDQEISFLKNEEGLCMNVRIFPYEDKKDEVSGYVEVWNDVTEFKNIESKVQSHVTDLTSKLNNLLQTLNKLEKGEVELPQLELNRENNEGLYNAVYVIADNMKDLNLAIHHLNEAVLNGNLFYRSDSDLKGTFKQVIDGTHDIMDCYVNLLDNINSSVLIVDQDYNIQFANQFALDYSVVNTGRDKAIGSKCYHIFGCDREECKAADCIGKDKKISFIESGSGLDFAVDMIPYKDKDGKIRGIIEVSKDVTGLKNTERKVQKQLDYQKNEIEKLITNLNKLELGDLDLVVLESAGDEDTKEIADNFHQLNQSLMKSTNAIKNYIEEISEVLAEIAHKNISRGIERDYLGDFYSLKNSINYITDQYNVILSEISSAANQVEIGAQQVSLSSQDLSRGASEQAGIVEQIVATITNVAEQTKQNAVNANKANGFSSKTKEDAQNGKLQMQEMLTAMNEIKESSKNIGNIIKVIDDIAFQTNLLALNAAVEAARAGQYGKGFAVVAEEVRNLASRSSEAVKETANMIENSIHKVEIGNQMVIQTAESLNKIVNDVTDTVEIVGTIAEASLQQAEAIEQIYTGINQVSKVTQANTATAEENAAASEEMAGQAELLKSQISEFKLKENQPETLLFAMQSTNSRF